MENKPYLMIVEDDLGLQKQLKWALKSDYSILFADNKIEAMTLFKSHAPRVVVHDLGLPPDSKGVSEGRESIESILHHSPEAKIIVMTGKGDQRDAIDMVGLGAHDFLSKPVELKTLKLIIERAMFLSKLDNKFLAIREESSIEIDDDFVLPGVVGQSEVMRSVASRVKKVSKTSATIFIQGESGTGKELIARAIHSLSPRKEEPFIAINCAAIPESLLESELFGYEKGAFTGANKRTTGKIEQANAGTLFLDEIGDMAYDLQSKILRFLQERTIQRVGGSKDVSVDVRIVSATHQNLQYMIEEKQFRQDLYYRINEIEIQLPPLKARGGDIVLIARYLLEKFSRAHGKFDIEFSNDALNGIEKAEWKGNIRQLSNQINKSVILCDSNLISVEDVELGEISGEISSQFERDISLDNIPTLKSAKENIEFELVVKAMAANDNNVNSTAQLLGVTRQRVYELLKKHKIVQ